MNKVSTRPGLLGSVLWVVSLLVLVAPRGAYANGAFPDSQGLLLPADKPNQIIVATNFGVVLSQDGGQTWTWSCERMDNGATAAFYQLSATPRDRLFAITDLGLIYSDDAACGWSKAQGMLAGKPPLDYFPDSANPNRVWAVRPPDVDGGAYTVVESLDGGNTFTTIRFTSAAGDAITGLEIARTDANVAYLTIRSGSGFLPKLATTKNGGTTWDTRDVSGMFGNVNVRIRIIAVDPTNANRLLLRVSLPSGDALALSLDGGQTFVSPNPLTVPDGVLTSFVRLANGTLILGGVDVLRDVIFRSTNGGTSFTELDAPPVRGLGTRDGRLFMVSSNDTAVGGFAVGESTDEGQTWRSLLRYEEIQAIAACVKTLCQDDCVMKANIDLWPPEMCAADPMPRTPADGGAHDAAPARDAGLGSESGSCSCGVGAPDAAPAGQRGALGLATIMVAALVTMRARRRR